MGVVAKGDNWKQRKKMAAMIRSICENHERSNHEERGIHRAWRCKQTQIPRGVEQLLAVPPGEPENRPDDVAEEQQHESTLFQDSIR